MSIEPIIMRSSITGDIVNQSGLSKYKNGHS